MIRPHDDGGESNEPDDFTNYMHLYLLIEGEDDRASGGQRTGTL
jgi:hypothetical protein